MYGNLEINAYFLFTLDLQYLKDRCEPAASGDAVDGWIAGGRATAAF